MKVEWSNIKEFVDTRGLSIQYVDIGTAYWIKAFDHAFEMECVLQKDNPNDDLVDFETNYKPSGNKKLSKTTAEGYQVVDVGLRKGVAGTDSLTLISPDLTDRTCWYQGAVKVVDQALTDVGTGLSFQAASGFRHWINIHSEKLTYDHNKLLLRDGTFGQQSEYEVLVKVDSVEADPSTYTVDFPSGTITFSSSKSGSTVTATYYHNDGTTNPSDYLIRPQPGYVLRIEHVEVQFSSGISFSSPVSFEIWAGGALEDYADFPDYLYEAGYGQSRSLYRGHRDLINWCNNQYPVIPPCGDLTQTILVFPFMFLVAADINSLYGTTLRISLVEQIPLVGEIATVTLYCETFPAT